MQLETIIFSSFAKTLFYIWKPMVRTLFLNVARNYCPELQIVVQLCIHRLIRYWKENKEKSFSRSQNLLNPLLGLQTLPYFV